MKNRNVDKIRTEKQKENNYNTKRSTLVFIK